MVIPTYTEAPVDQIPKIRDNLGKAFKSGKTKSIQFRKEQLLRLAYLIKDNTPRFQEALARDLGRNHVETSILEIEGTLGEIKDTYHNVSKWAKPDSVPWQMNWFAMGPKVRKEPKGVVLIISPFNYPIWNSLVPFVGAMAAGCAVALKPSEMTPATSALVAELFPKYLDPDLYTIVNGTVPQSTKLLEFPWDHVLYTGSGRVARIVLTAAAKTLTPVSTELGGKCPVVIDSNCDVKIAATRLMWGKTANAGQTCVAPDYVIVEKSFAPTLVQACKDVLKEFYPNGAEKSDSFSHIISAGHFDRLKGLIDNTKGEIVYGGGADKDKLFIEPTVVLGVDGNDTLMSEELFGPVLPIVTVKNIDEAIDFINARDHSLALYVFSKSSAFKAKILDNTQSGAILMNEVFVHAAVDGFPFGGIGPSGSGSHKGRFGFNTFTHLRPTLDNPSWTEMLVSLRYPPYTAAKARRVKWILAPTLPARPSSLPPLSEGKKAMRWGLWLLIAAVAVGVGLIQARHSA